MLIVLGDTSSYNDFNLKDSLLWQLFETLIYYLRKPEQALLEGDCKKSKLCFPWLQWWSCGKSNASSRKLRRQQGKVLSCKTVTQESKVICYAASKMVNLPVYEKNTSKVQQFQMDKIQSGQKNLYCQRNSFPNTGRACRVMLIRSFLPIALHRNCFNHIFNTKLTCTDWKFYFRQTGITSPMKLSPGKDQFYKSDLRSLSKENHLGGHVDKIHTNCKKPSLSGEKN